MIKNKEIESIETKEDLADFIFGLKEDLLHTPNEWENVTLECFLEAMESWIRVIDAYAENSNDHEIGTASWRTFAKILSAAKVYE